ncbi:MAG: acyl-CoA thioesterase [Propionibacteriaceae bacterium]
MSHRYLAPVRWGDMDAQGHVNNAAYLDYLQDARVDFLVDATTGLGALLDTGVLVVNHQVEYIAPVQFRGEPVTVDLWIDALGASRFVVGYELRDADGRLALRARTGAVPYDLAANRLRRLLPTEREVLAGHLAPAEPLRVVDKVPTSATAHHWPLTVRWSDLDSYGHVNNVKYYDYVQEARIALMTEALGWTGDEVWSLVRQDLEYARPIDFRAEPYEVITSVAHVGTRSLTLSVAIRDPALPATVFATARSIVVGEAAFTEEQHQRLNRTDWLTVPSRNRRATELTPSSADHRWSRG